MITVIIPTLNEQSTISQVVKLVQSADIVTEILVIDDKSLDDTVNNAKSDKVKIFTSTKLGKGASMRDGMLLASNEIIAYLDADIITYPQDIIQLLTSTDSFRRC
ncbi:MAG: glycosyltransferase [Bacteroidetes bacterium]|nr:glycosyltransferase [Bacteroidota bacterium]